jgi:CopG family transcriptional regulator, nickel-responsive regulator
LIPCIPKLPVLTQPRREPFIPVDPSLFEQFGRSLNLAADGALPGAARGDRIAPMTTKRGERVTRFSISLPVDLAKQLDRMTREKGYDNRSLAVADMIRAHLVEHRQKLDQREIAGTITLVYDHHKTHVQATLTDIQHDHHSLIVATLHVHLDHDNCMEVLAVRGRASAVKRIADELIAAKGVKHGKLTVTSTGKDLPG